MQYLKLYRQTVRVLRVKRLLLTNLHREVLVRALFGGTAYSGTTLVASKYIRGRIS